jgi:hypothetical protein
MKKHIVSLCFLSLFVAGYVYADCISGNCYNGQGTFTYANGNKYVGRFKDGRPDGQGTMTYDAGGLAEDSEYVGQWKNGKREGQGTWTYGWDFTGDEGGKYVGQWKDDKREGQGTLTEADGHKYVGQWKDDKRYEGTVYNPDGTITRFRKGQGENNK